MLDIFWYVVSVIVLGAMALLASFAFRGGEVAGYHHPAAGGVLTAGAGGSVRRRDPRRWMFVNQVLVWGAALTLLAAGVALVIATIASDALHWP